jgi:hypothetical protein
MANLSRSARVTSGLRFLQERGTQLRLTEASLFFRREAVLARIGWFDSVRKAADTGYRLRIEAEFGRPVPVIDVEAPLTLVRYGSGSLSGSDLRDGWTHPARVAYSSALATWIQTERAAGRPPFLAPSPDPRPFPVHPSLLGRDAPDIDLDILYVVDVRVDRERDTTGIDREILEAADSGLRVGVRRAERLRAEWVSPHARRGLQEAINAGRLVEVIPGDPTAARLVLVPDASVLDGVPVGPAVRSGRVVVGRHPSMPGASIEDGVRRLTGTQAEVTDERGAREARRGLSPH